MGLYKRPDSDTYWMSFTYDGRLYRKSTGTSDEKLARKIFAKVETQIAEDKWFDLDQAQQHTFDEMMEKYMTEYSKIHKATSTYEKDKSMVAHLSGFFSGLTLNRISPRIINDYKTMRLSQKAAPSSVRNELRLLSHAFNIAIREWEWLRDNPVSRVSLRELKARAIDRWLTAEEEAHLLNAADGKLDGQLSDIIILACYTGLSQEQILKLRWQDVDFERKTISTVRKKTGEARTIPINATVLELLSRRFKVKHISGSEYVFFNRAGNKWDAGKLKRIFIKTVKESGIRHFRFHDLRHTFGSRLTQNGVDLYKVSKLMLHKNIETTQRYAHHYPESLRDGVEVLDKLKAKDDAQFHVFFTLRGEKAKGSSHQSAKGIEN